MPSASQMNQRAASLRFSTSTANDAAPMGPTTNTGGDGAEGGLGSTRLPMMASPVREIPALPAAAAAAVILGADEDQQRLDGDEQCQIGADGGFEPAPAAQLPGAGEPGNRNRSQ